MSDDRKTSAPWDLPQPGGRRLLRRLLPWAGVLLLLGLVAWGLWPKAVVVETAEVVKRPLTVTVSEEGKTRIRNRYVVTAPVSGNLERVTLKAGDALEADKSVMARVMPMAAPLLDARSQEQAKQAWLAAQASEQQAKAAHEAAQRAAIFATAERDRVEALGEGAGLSRSAREKIESEAAIRSAEERSASFGLKLAEAEVARAKAMMDRPAADPLSVVELRAPVDGVVLKVIQESETAVTAGQPILEAGDPRDLEIEAEILSRDAVGIKEGDPVRIEQWGGEVDLKGRVRRVEPAAFTRISALGVEEQRVLVLIDLMDPPPAARRLGDRFRVEVRVAVWHSDEVVAVPSGALFRKDNDWMVFRRDGSRARLVKVEAGVSDGHFTQVLSGLGVGEEVLVHPPDAVADGVRVRRD